jgi:FkbM family methyltransferase
MGISSELLLFKTHEPLSTEVLKGELKKGMICLCVGANIGYYALLERKLVGEEGTVIAIEPSPLNYSYLKYNLQQNGFADVPTFNCAFSSHDGTLPFLMNSSSNLSSLIKANEPSSNGRIINVCTRSLDSFAEQYKLGKLDFLSMDVEGCESEIFHGGWRTIEMFKPALFIEVHKDSLGPKLTFKFLKDLQNYGYEVKYYIPRELDIPLIGNMTDVKEIKLARLLEMLSDGSLPDCFHLYLVQSGVKNITVHADSSSIGNIILNVP